MLQVLVVEDDNYKFGLIFRTLTEAGVDDSRICHAIASTQAFEFLRDRKFDLMLLDINIPRRLGDHVLRGGGLELLRKLARNQDIHTPHHIVGVTAYEDVVEEFGPEFDDQLWSLIKYGESSDRWIAQLKSKVNYIAAAKRSENFSDGRTYGVDFAIICALEEPELVAVRRLPFDWQITRLPHDDTRYWTGTVHKGSKHASIIATSAPRMGIAASAVIATKLILRYRPKHLIMTGICAGRAEKVQIGDVIVADPTWDWGSGKITSKENRTAFQPSPHHLDLEPECIPIIRDLAEDAGRLAVIKQHFAGPKPNSELRVHVGALASGAAVVADKATLDNLLIQHRGLLGIEMEAYGVMSAARGTGLPRPSTIIMKAVCDYADKDKSDDYQAYAAYTSVALLEQFLQKMMS